MPYYGPQEDEFMLFLEKTFLLSTFVATIGYGVQLVFYGVCASYLWRQRDRQGIIALLRLAYITTLIILESLVVASSAWVIEKMYIQNRNYPGGPMAWFLAVSAAPVDIMFYWSFFLLTFMSDLLALWRCWIIWSTAGKLIIYIVMSPPVTVLLASSVLGVMWAYQSSRPGLTLYSRLSVDVGTAYYVTSLSVNIVVTMLIISRLLLHRRVVLKILPADHTKNYVSVATIIIESLLVYSIFALAFIITYALNNPMNQVFMYMGSACQQISGYILILRVANGRAWTSSTMGTISKCHSSLRFNPPVPTSLGGIESRFDHSYDKHLSTTSDIKPDIQDSV